MRSRIFLFGLIGLTLLGVGLGCVIGSLPSFSLGDSPRPLIGSVRAFEAAYARWKAAAEKNGQKTKLVMALGYYKGLSSEFSRAAGQALIDLSDGSLIVEIVGLPEDREFAVWLVQNRPGSRRSVKPEPGDRMIRLGSLEREGAHARLKALLDRKKLEGFKLDLLAVTPEGRDPTEGGLIYGSPNVFQKIYYAQAKTSSMILSPLKEAEKSAIQSLAAPFRFIVPALAYANDGGNPQLAALIARGERLFFEEKFHGNGRTCGTCHPADNNFTIDPAYIATLPNNDPLFVAEFKRELNSATNGGNHFEIPQLLRQFGLILLNVDDTDDLANKFVLRGVPHTFALGLSITPATFDGTSASKLQRTGWDGGGAFGSGGTLREFAVGAVAQHFTRTLDRIPGRDFRLPTDSELDAIEAFLLSLGRQAELDLGTLSLKDYDADQGKILFNSQTTGKCAMCHFNAGANHGLDLPGVTLGSENANFDIGIENATHPADGLGLPRPRDGGFGTAGNLTNGFGDGTFNTPSLVEAADTPPFFHNNQARTIEEAVAFYTTADFNGSPGAGVVGPIALGQVAVNQLAAFLRVINALENIRSAGARLAGALDGLRPPQIDKLIALAIVDISDAIRVLRDVPSSFKIDGLHPEARAVLEDAIVHCETARQTGNKVNRAISLQAALNALEAAKGEIVD